MEKMNSTVDRGVTEEKIGASVSGFKNNLLVACLHRKKCMHVNGDKESIKFTRDH